MEFNQNNLFLIDLVNAGRNPAACGPAWLPDFWPSHPVLWFAIRAGELFQHHWAAAVVMLDSTVDEELAEAVGALAVKAGKGKFADNKKSGGQSATRGGGASC